MKTRLWYKQELAKLLVRINDDKNISADFIRGFLVRIWHERNILVSPEQQKKAEEILEMLEAAG